MRYITWSIEARDTTDGTLKRFLLSEKVTADAFPAWRDVTHYDRFEDLDFEPYHIDTRDEARKQCKAQKANPFWAGKKVTFVPAKIVSEG